MSHRALIYNVESSKFLFIFYLKKKNPLQYLFKAQFFMLWTLLGLGRDKIGLGYTSEGSSSSEPKKEVRFILAKNVEKSQVEKLEIETPTVVKRTIGPKPKEKEKSLPKSQNGPQVKHFCYHCGMQWHIRPNCFKFQALKRADSLRGQDNSRRMPKQIQAKCENEGKIIGDVMKMLKNISSCLASFTLRFESYVDHTPPSKDLTQNTCTMWVKKGTHA